MARRCSKCLQWKEPSEFHRDRTKLSGLKSQCKDCQNRYKLQYRTRRRAQRYARLRRIYMQLWMRKASRRVRLDRTPGFRRWCQKSQTRRQAYLSSYLRRWHVQHREASRVWYQDSPEIPTVQRQARRASAARVAVNALDSMEWKWLLDLFGHRCAYCGQPSDYLTPDHVVPLSRGGRNVLSNIVPACRACNSRKGMRTPEESGMGFAMQVDVVSHLEQLALM